LPRFPLPPALDGSADVCVQEVAVKVPRFRIVGLMVFIALAALNFAAIRAVSDIRSHTHNHGVAILALGALPMANVLTVGILIGQRHRGNRPFLLGFEAFGAVALVLYLALMGFFAEESVVPYLYLVLTPLARTIGPHIPVRYAITAVLLGLPQLAFALIGGVLSRQFGIAE
jgi:hypothetical protein